LPANIRLALRKFTLAPLISISNEENSFITLAPVLKKKLYSFNILFEEEVIEKWFHSRKTDLNG